MNSSRVLACFLALFPAAAQAAALVDQPYRLDKFDRPLTDLTINGAGPFTFIVDTASSTSFIFSNARDKLLPAAGNGATSFDTYGLSRMVKTEPLTLDEVKLSGLTFRQMRMGVLQGGANADGILGIDVVEKYTVVLDRNQMRFQVFSAGDEGRKSWEAWPSVELRPRALQTVNGTFWTVPAGVNNRPVTAILDLGAGITVMNWAAAEQIGIERREIVAGGPPDQRLRDMLGTTAPAVNTLADITIAGHLFRGQRILIADAQVFGFIGLANVPAAIIGTGLLRDHSVAVDFPARKFYVSQEVATK